VEKEVKGRVFIFYNPVALEVLNQLEIERGHGRERQRKPMVHWMNAYSKSPHWGVQWPNNHLTYLNTIDMNKYPAYVSGLGILYFFVSSLAFFFFLFLIFVSFFQFFVFCYFFVSCFTFFISYFLFFSHFSFLVSYFLFYISHILGTNHQGSAICIPALPLQDLPQHTSLKV
jgi:hypothetical protein